MRDLLAHHGVEGQRGVVGGQPDAYDPPTGTDQLDGHRAGGLGANGVEHEVEPELFRRLPRRVAIRKNHVAAERPGPLAPRVLRLDHRHRRDLVQQRGLKRDQADCARADHRGRAHVEPSEAEPHGVDAVGQRLGQRADPYVEPSGSTRRFSAGARTRSANAPSK